MNKIEAAQYMGVSLRTLENYMKRGLAYTFEDSSKSRPIVVFTETDLDDYRKQLASERNIHSTVAAPDTAIGTVVVTATQKPEVAATQSIVPANNFNWSEALLAELINRLGQGRAEVVEIRDKIALTFAEAAAISGVSEKKLRDAAKAGQLASNKNLSRAQKILRTDLDEWVAAQFKMK